MRVAHFLPNLIAGGRERYTIDRCREAARAGDDPCIICYDPETPGTRLVAPEIPLHAIDRRRPDFVTALTELLTTERIDVLHAQGHVAAALAAPIAGQWPVDTTLHIALGSGWRWLPSIVRGLRRSCSVSAVSADLARRYRLLAGRPIAIVIPQVDQDRFKPRRGAPNNAIFTIGIAARLHPVKRHRDLLAAVRILEARGIPCRLRIAGEGPLACDLRRQANGLDVHFDGHVEDMPTWLGLLDTFALPSDHEGTPLALLEAQAIGLPCIAADVGGVRECVSPDTILVPRRAPSAIAEALERIHDDLREAKKRRSGAIRDLDEVRGALHRCGGDGSSASR